ncbi:Oidioi.mRNA.OKI2018_I69.chr2.g8170.t3.cds [Oikopleura dioica]|uniref:Oidioi.mRNA.OKI2018_I69.chr2.g8170.t3.cds n=1 Tax=Oikopleura dioica TaxID=34765 RepID=A0ABN7T9G1_OIKDI|nr:Oidioi.mRNA.OKI2018_I69.chr2.g8170.t3.cds [Oikopleura dioica]
MAWRSRLKALVAPTLAAGSVLTLREQSSSEGTPFTIPKQEVQAKSRRDRDEGRQKVNSKRRRFENFATVQVNGELFMTPADFLESVTEDNPRKSSYKISYSVAEIEANLKQHTPARNKIQKGATDFFRKLGKNGIISYNEYLFLLCIITKPKQGFEVAFKMFDTDGNQLIDSDEFKVLEDIFRQSAENATNQRWDSRAYYEEETIKNDFEGTTLRYLFFGQDGKKQINHDLFYAFMHNLQAEVLELEFNAFARGKWDITELEFAEMLLRYTDQWDMDQQLERIQGRLSNQEGISMEEFKSFFFFLNNLEDFATAVHYYALANQPIGPEEFHRAVKISTGEDLSENLVNVVYAIFDKDGDRKLSHKEFIGVMSDRLSRQNKFRRANTLRSSFDIFKRCYFQTLAENQDTAAQRILFKTRQAFVPDDFEIFLKEKLAKKDASLAENQKQN